MSIRCSVAVYLASCSLTKNFSSGSNILAFRRHVLKAVRAEEFNGVSLPIRVFLSRGGTKLSRVAGVPTFPTPVLFVSSFSVSEGADPSIMSNS